MREIALPTFEVGQRVRVLNRPVEFQCLGCGKGIFNKRPYGYESIEIVVRRVTNPMHCASCGRNFEAEGWWVTVDDDGDEGCIPYTLLEPIEE